MASRHDNVCKIKSFKNKKPKQYNLSKNILNF